MHASSRCVKVRGDDVFGSRRAVVGFGCLHGRHCMCGIAVVWFGSCIKGWLESRDDRLVLLIYLGRGLR